MLQVVVYARCGRPAITLFVSCLASGTNLLASSSSSLSRTDIPIEVMPFIVRVLAIGYSLEVFPLTTLEPHETFGHPPGEAMWEGKPRNTSHDQLFKATNAADIITWYSHNICFILKSISSFREAVPLLAALFSDQHSRNRAKTMATRSRRLWIAKSVIGSC